MSLTDPEPTTTPPVWSVGEVADRLGVPAPTLRTWERRYGLGPSARSSGGHRRYTTSDIERLETMCRLLQSGLPPARAAHIASRTPTTTTDATGEPGEVNVPDAVIAAARAYDAIGLTRIIDDCLNTHRLPVAWNDHLVPALHRVGQEWETGHLGVDGEHLISDILLTALRARIHTRTLVGTNDRPIVLASAENDQHALPLLALQATLAETDITCHMLGARTPATALAATIQDLKPAAIFLWASMNRPTPDPLTRTLTNTPTTTHILLGGPGWHTPPTNTTTCTNLNHATHLINTALTTT